MTRAHISLIILLLHDRTDRHVTSVFSRHVAINTPTSPSIGLADSLIPQASVSGIDTKICIFMVPRETRI